MLRSLSRHLSQRSQERRERKERQASPDYACAKARRIEHKHKEAQTLRKSWEAGDESSFYTNRSLEALQLEPIIAPTLRRMAPTVATREALAPPPLRGNAPRFLQLPPPSQKLPAQVTDVVILSRSLPGITETPGHELQNPFEQLNQINELQVTSYPVRPILRRQAVSYRTHRDLPLRIQAVRRAHQEEFSRLLAQRPILPMQQRRDSTPEHSALPLRAFSPTEPIATAAGRPPQPLRPPEALRRTRSEAQLYQVPQRAHARESSQARHAHLMGRAQQAPADAGEQSGASKRGVHPGEDVTDYYISSAQYLWQMPEQPSLGE